MAALSSFTLLARARSPSNPSGKARMLRRRGHRTPDPKRANRPHFWVLPLAAPSVPENWLTNFPEFALERPSVQPPAGASGRRPYTRLGEKGKIVRKTASGASLGASLAPIRVLDQLSKPNREFHAFAQSLVVPESNRLGRSSQFLHPDEQHIETLGEQLLAERRIGARAGEVAIGDRRKSAHHETLLATDPLGELPVDSPPYQSAVVAFLLGQRLAGFP